MQKRSQVLIDKVDSSVEVLLQKFHDIVELSLILDKSEETLAVETLQIESNTTSIIKVAEELLTITRSLKEAWTLGQVPKSNLTHDYDSEIVDPNEKELLDAKIQKSLEQYNNLNALLEQITDLK
ncbi:unnamed protein product [[Candida] boidinii]|uniref:Unnamed protein product n=1 Tax=Candida boidinii TaxID=5477 RepID=A0A9W6SWV9_CANBO|nr:unnamed protein product [[Candida] boidinii]GMF99088.1 unnamed protein product [[Candida] boidinii]